MARPPDTARRDPPARSSELLKSTLRPSDVPPLAERARTPALTVLFHPQVGRIGEQARLSALLEGQPCLLSRIEPAFAPPGSDAAEPLADPFVSRRAVRLAPCDGGVRLSPAAGADLVVDGEPLASPRDVGTESLDRGVVIELGGRVVLLLHRLPIAAARPLPRLGLVGDSEGIERVRAEVLKVADVAAPILLRGESGTGKEVVAKAIVEAGPRSRAPFVTVNMAAVPPALGASQLFGHAPGAFTGATRAQPGYFEQADGGTIFLDEVGELSLELQSMLLRVLESHEIQPVGEPRTRKVDVRVLAATDSDLREAVRAGRFREALLQRLSGYEIRMPPLRERRDDLGRLLVHRLAIELGDLGEGERLGALEGSHPWLSPSVVGVLTRYDWPGNVRELVNVARHIAIAARGGRAVTLETVASRLQPRTESASPAGSPAEAHEPRRSPSSIPEETLVAALRKNGWRLAATARTLCISRNSLYGLIEASDRIRKAKDIPAEEIRRCHDECRGNLDAMSARLEVSSRGLKLRMTELGIR